MDFGLKNVNMTLSMNQGRTLFKYTDLKGATAILENGNLLFSSPLYFNDPFDISIQTLFGYDPFDLEGFLDEFVGLATSGESLPEGNGNENSDKFIALRSILSKASVEDKKVIRVSLSAEDIWSEDQLRKHGEEVQITVKTVFETAGIFCASKRPDNYLLWAHYADKHQGAVLEFSPNIDRDSMLIHVEEVEYTNKRPHLYDSHRDFLIKSMFRKTDDFLAEYTKKITKTKSLEWAYEEEIRLYNPMLVNTLKGKRHHCLDYHDDELRSVYLGCKMNAEVKRGIAALAVRRNPDVHIFEMIPDPHHYKLDPRKYE